MFEIWTGYWKGAVCAVFIKWFFFEALFGGYTAVIINRTVQTITKTIRKPMGKSRLTSIVHCDAAVWRRSLGCYLWSPFLLLFIGKLQRERNTLCGKMKASTHWRLNWLLSIIKQILLDVEISHFLCGVEWLTELNIKKISQKRN